MQEAYHDKVAVPGDTSNQTIELVRIPEGRQLRVHHFAAGIYTTNPGDYTSAKFIWLGYEQNGVKYYLQGHDINAAQTGNQAVVFVKNFVIPENGIPFAYVEDTAATVTVEVMINGIIEDKTK